MMQHPPIQILLVEDNADHAELIRRNLEAIPFRCELHRVEDGESALDYIFGTRHFADRKKFPLPQLVLLDLRLPRLNGVEVLRLVKNNPQFAFLPIVVLTTSDAEQDLTMALQCGATKFLTKPVEADVLVRLFLGLGFEPAGLVNAGSPVPSPRISQS